MSEKFMEKVLKTPRSVQRLNIDEFWQNHSDYVIRADQIDGNPFFYPVYRWNDLYSFSPLPLMIRKGTFHPDRSAVQNLSAHCNDGSYPMPFIDQDIQRIGEMPVLSRKIRDPADFINRIAKAMQQDADTVEKQNPGKINVLLCGGQDSLNLLLLDWQNPVVAYSAMPNTPLVAEFCHMNGLDIEVRELLSEEDPDLLPREIAEAATMVELENWKWTPHLLRVSEEVEKEAIFWKGQFADAFLTDYWRSYTSLRSRHMKIGKKLYRRFARNLPTRLLSPMDRFFLQDFAKAIWQRGSVQQGAHMGFLRSITDCLWVSGYHGPQTTSVWTAADLPYLTRSDLRPEIGARLLGRAVKYPGQNPNPPTLTSRKGLRGVAQFTAALDTFGISTDRTQR